MNNFFELRNTGKLVKSKAKLGNSKTQSSHFWRKRSKDHWSTDMEYLTLPYKNFGKFK